MMQMAQGHGMHTLPCFKKKRHKTRSSHHAIPRKPRRGILSLFYSKVSLVMQISFKGCPPEPRVK